jgi:glyoxylase-like metal-dependent hydrolase (beta-lactamase superfamily II)
MVRDGPRIVDASSTVTLVQSTGQILVVDTGAPSDMQKITSALRALGFKSTSVGYVVNTHLHIDHIGCNHLFENARLVAHRLEDPPVGTLRLSERTTLLPNVEIVSTPGHSAGSLSVFVTAERKYAIVGDAIPTKANYDQHVPPFLNMNKALALKSMDMILEWADVVVPGHDSPFEVLGKKYDG